MLISQKQEKFLTELIEELNAINSVFKKPLIKTEELNKLTKSQASSFISYALNIKEDISFGFNKITDLDKKIASAFEEKPKFDFELKLGSSFVAELSRLIKKPFDNAFVKGSMTLKENGKFDFDLKIAKTEVNGMEYALPEEEVLLYLETIQDEIVQSLKDDDIAVIALG